MAYHRHMTTRDTLITLTQDLIRIPSLSGEESDVVRFIATVMENLGYDAIHIDEVGSITGSIYGNAEGASILLDCHIDTVGVDNRDAWSSDPCAAEIRDDCIYGRGAADMKGAAAAMIAAVGDFKRQTGGAFSGSVHVACTVCEECFEGYAASLVSTRIKADVVIIGEASELNLKRGQRGRAEISLSTFGRSCHSSNPEEGVNAIEAMLTVLPKILSLPAPSHPVLGDGILVATDIISTPYPGRSVLPDRCTVTFDRRLLIGESPSSILAPIKGILDEHPAIEATLCCTEGEIASYTGQTIKAERFFDAWLMADDHPVVQQSLDALNEIGIPARLSHYRFCTNGSRYAGVLAIPTIGFGPGADEMAHTVDEHIAIDDLVTAHAGYLALIKRLLSKR